MFWRRLGKMLDPNPAHILVVSKEFKSRMSFDQAKDEPNKQHAARNKQ